MELRLTNGSVVNRVWRDNDGKDITAELTAGFQYEDDAILFAKARLAKDAERNLGVSHYIVTNTYSGGVTIIRQPAPSQMSA